MFGTSAMDSSSCKACGESQLKAKERRPLQGLPYSTLFDIATAKLVSPSEVHKILASGESYVCKRCHSALAKYASIREHMRKIEAHVSSMFSDEQNPLPQVSCINQFKVVPIVNLI